jgi:aspartyl-tRNA(Asn)/glutamyl-tRNA(Gln) amidotransferase subunit A
MTSPTTLTIAQARAALAKKELSAVELADAHLDAIEKARALNAYVLETPERARAMAKAADARIAAGKAGPLEGIPLGIKDLFCTEGVRTTACSHILKDFTPTYESTVSANLWRDGAVMLGKLNNDEFAMGSSNETSCFGPVVNPWRRKGANVQLVPGGGCGASVSRRDGDRYRRLDPAAGGVHRHGRHQADLRALLALGHRRVRLVARSGRADRARCPRQRDPAALDGRLRSEGHNIG